jgi:Fe-S-cluster formation regulator IscX/YfhJ
MDLEGRFRNSLPVKPEDQDLSDFIKELLILSKQILEQEKLGKMDLISTSSQLDRVEERMVWILPKDIKISKIHEIVLDLDRFKADTNANYEKLLQDCQKQLDNSNHQDIDRCNATIEEIVRAINKDILDKRINTGLQIERLRSLRFWRLILLIFYIFLFPMVGIFDYYRPYTYLTTSILLSLKDIPMGVLKGMTQLYNRWLGSCPRFCYNWGYRWFS